MIPDKTTIILTAVLAIWALNLFMLTVLPFIVECLPTAAFDSLVEALLSVPFPIFSYDTVLAFWPLTFYEAPVALLPGMLHDIIAGLSALFANYGRFALSLVSLHLLFVALEV